MDNDSESEEEENGFSRAGVHLPGECTAREPRLWKNLWRECEALGEAQLGERTCDFAQSAGCSRSQQCCGLVVGTGLRERS